MIELFYWPTPNGHKITIFLEESGLPYQIIPIDITKGDQFKEEFLKISPNNRMPAIIDSDPNLSKPIAIFESGAILMYLAEKTGKFLPNDNLRRYECLQWLFWQVGGLGPMAGQNHHFTNYANEKVPYAIERYVRETSRLYGVLNKQLADQDYIAADYSIADMACYPWIVPYEKQQQDLENYPHLKRWFLKMQERAAVKQAYSKGEEIKTEPVMSDEAKKILFNQDSNNRHV